MTAFQSAAWPQFRTQYTLPLNDLDEEINVDLFAGGGASTGIEMGLGRPVHIAINHNPAAISMHEANHPGALHLQTDVWDVDPVRVLAGRKIGWFHASPDCTHFSQAKGGQARSSEIRNLSWVVQKWAGVGRPRIISLENVKQIQQWGPLVAKRDKETGRAVRIDGSVASPGERVPRHEQFLVPDSKRRGQTWKRFLSQLARLGYVVEYRILKACDYGAPTSRERLFLVARRDGLPIAWPEPTHAATPTKSQKPYRTAAECIDWSIPGQSIFDRSKPLAEATMKRIAKGIKREVIDRAKPFIVPIANWSTESIQSADKPLNTITSWPRGGSFAACTAFLAQANGGFNTTHSKPLTEPITTITNTGSQQQLVTAFLHRQFGASVGQACDAPAPTITAGGGGKTALVELQLSQEAERGALRCAAFMMSYYGTGNLSSVDGPLPTITTKDRLALVTVWIGDAPYVIVDICLRMLQPHELYAAQGFPANYIIDHGHDGRRFTKSEQVHMCGNSVSPPPMAAIAAANNPWRERLFAAA
jgi:DNA (cytosine-5)-methyltransferase 1